MPPRNHHPNRAVSGSASEETIEDPSTQDDATSEHGETEINDAEITTEEAWATSAGYTQLADMNYDGAMFMALPVTGPDNGDVENVTYSGTFFADLTAYGRSDELNESDGGGDEPEDTEEEGQHDNFRSIADQALLGLDDEYSTTVATAMIPSADLKNEATLEPSKIQVSAPVAPATNDDKPVSMPTVPTSVDLKPKVTGLSLPESKDNPPFDTDAVRKAVDAIRLKAPRWTTEFDKWEEQHFRSTCTRVVEDHSIIPQTPRSAFCKRTPRAIAATANLSRSATLAEAIQRLSLLSRDKLVIHIVGADHVECNKLESTFGPLVRWIDALEQSPKQIEIQLVGPNVPSDATKRPPTDLMPKQQPPKSRLVSALATCHESVYHEWLPSDQGCLPDVAVAFNSGIWGYSEWVPTIQALCESSWQIPFVSTAYTIEECLDDFDVIDTAVSSSSLSCQTDDDDDFQQQCCLWKPELNTFGSNMRRETANAVPGREYRENSAWQAWKLGGRKPY